MIREVAGMVDGESTYTHVRWYEYLMWYAETVTDSDAA